ncbi:MAG: DUF89 family protein, partial [Candidatus Aminicenantes bacterium]|nr:DUF89 family protein [Candidatus Aminicenantes bacterium]
MKTCTKKYSPPHPRSSDGSSSRSWITPGENMKTSLGCYPCFFTQILKTSAVLGLDEDQTQEAMARFGSWLAELPLEASPAANGRQVYRILSEISGIEDPYREIKDKCTQTALKLYPELKQRVRSAPDPLFEAIQVAVAGNLIDFGTMLDFDIKEDIEAILHQEFFINHFPAFKAHLAQAQDILFLGDNAGETVFDRILIEELPQRVQYVVREKPIINDATFEDAVAAGIAGIADIISSGSDAPATIVELCSPEFQERLRSADLIISKGQGNYEGLSEESLPIF